MTETRTKPKSGIHFPVPKGKHGAPSAPAALRRPAAPVPRVAVRTKASTKGR